MIQKFKYIKNYFSQTKIFLSDKNLEYMLNLALSIILNQKIKKMTATDWIGFIGVTILLFAYFLNLRDLIGKDSFSNRNLLI